MQNFSPGGDSSASWLWKVGLSLTPPLEELRVNRNTSDFILEHFIAFYFNGTSVTLFKRIWNLTVMAIQHYNSWSCSKHSKNSAMIYSDQLTVITLSTVGVTLTSLQLLEFTVNKC